MARPTGSGLDYFPLDTDIDQDDKIALVESDYGVEGFGIIIKLLMKVYSTGYFYEWGEKEQKLFVRRVNVDINTLSEVVNACIRWSVFDRHIFEQYGVLTSKGIQKRYLEACSRRKDVEFIQEYSLLSKTELKRYTNIVLVYIEDDLAVLDVDINYHSTDSMSTLTTQSKVKESKVKESKANNSNTEPVVADYSDIKNVFQIFQENFGMISPFIAESLQYWENDLGEELLIEAMKRAAKNQKQFSYAESIMKSWTKKNIKTMEQVEAEDVAFSNKNQKHSSFGKTQKKEALPDWIDQEQPKEETYLDEEAQKKFNERLERFRKGSEIAE